MAGEIETTFVALVRQRGSDGDSAELRELCSQLEQDSKTMTQALDVCHRDMEEIQLRVQQDLEEAQVLILLSRPLSLGVDTAL